MQYSYTQRELFYATDVAGMPQINQNMGLVSFRYYLSLFLQILANSEAPVEPQSGAGRCLSCHAGA